MFIFIQPYNDSLNSTILNENDPNLRPKEEIEIEDKLKEIRSKFETKPNPQTPAPTPMGGLPGGLMKGGLASGADLLKQEESQFVTAGQRANFVPDPKNLELLSKLPGRPSKSLMDIKKEMLQKANGQKDKPKLSFQKQLFRATYTVRLCLI